MFVHNHLPYLIMMTGPGGGSEGGGSGTGGGSGSGSGGDGDGSGSGGSGSGGNGNRGGSGSGGSGSSGEGNPNRSGGGNGSGPGGSGSGGNGNGGHRSEGSPDRRRKLDDMSADELRTYVRELRGESGDYRTRATAAEEQNTKLLAGIANMLGLTPEGEPDPEKLAADLESAAEKVKGLETELAVRRYAQDAGADANALLDSRSFMDDALGLDRGASDYGTKITDKIKTFVQNNPRAAVSGGGGSGFFRGAIGQQTPGQTAGQSGVASGRALRRERTNRTRPGQTTTT